MSETREQPVALHPFGQPLEGDLITYQVPSPFQLTYDSAGTLRYLYDPETNENLPAQLQEYSWALGDEKLPQERQKIARAAENEVKTLFIDELVAALTVQVNEAAQIDALLLGKKWHINAESNRVAKEIREDAEREIDAYFDALKQHHFAVHLSTLGVCDRRLKCITIDACVIPFADKSWNPLLSAVNTIRKFEQDFGHSALPKNKSVLIVELIDLTYTQPVHTGLGTREVTHSHMTQLTEGVGYSEAYRIRVSHWSQQMGGRTPDHILQTSDADQTVIHEMTHLLDGKSRATLAQGEAFATMRELDCRFERAVHELRELMLDQNTVSRGKIRSLFASDTDAMGTEGAHRATVIETYCLSAAVFCYIYEALGPKAFDQFYGLLTGDAAITASGEYMEVTPHSQPNQLLSTSCNLEAAYGAAAGLNNLDIDVEASLDQLVLKLNRAILTNQQLLLN